MTKEEKIGGLYNLKEYLVKNPIELDGYKSLPITLIDYAIEVLEHEPKTGHWISHREHCENLGVMPSGLGVYEWCSNCDCGIDVRERHRNHYNFCPNCGARMQESEG